MNAAEAETVFAEAERHGVKVVEAFMYRTHPTWLEVKRLVDAGEIGTLRHVQTFFGYCNLDGGNIRNIVEVGGGALYDVGCYAINSALWLFGTEPEVVGATIDRHHCGARSAPTPSPPGCSASRTARRRSPAPPRSSTASGCTSWASRVGSSCGSRSTSRSTCPRTSPSRRAGSHPSPPTSAASTSPSSTSTPPRPTRSQPTCSTERPRRSPPPSRSRPCARSTPSSPPPAQRTEGV